MNTQEKLEKAYMLTNSIDDAWWKNKEVEALHTRAPVHVPVHHPVPHLHHSVAPIVGPVVHQP